MGVEWWIMVNNGYLDIWWDMVINCNHMQWNSPSVIELNGVRVHWHVWLRVQLLGVYGIPHCQTKPQVFESENLSWGLEICKRWISGGLTGLATSPVLHGDIASLAASGQWPSHVNVHCGWLFLMWICQGIFHHVFFLNIPFLLGH